MVTLVVLVCIDLLYVCTYVGRHECTVHLSGLYSGSVCSGHRRKQPPVLDRQTTLVLNSTKTVLKSFSLLLYSATSLPLCNGSWITGGCLGHDSLLLWVLLTTHTSAWSQGSTVCVCMCVCLCVHRSEDKLGWCVTPVCVCVPIQQVIIGCMYYICRHTLLTSHVWRARVLWLVGPTLPIGRVDRAAGTRPGWAGERQGREFLCAHMRLYSMCTCLWVGGPALAISCISASGSSYCGCGCEWVGGCASAWACMCCVGECAFKWEQVEHGDCTLQHLLLVYVRLTCVFVCNGQYLTPDVIFIVVSCV